MQAGGPRARLVDGRNEQGVSSWDALRTKTVADGEGSDCSSGPAETSCVAPFRALGLDHATGGVSGPQRLFTRQTPE